MNTELVNNLKNCEVVTEVLTGHTSPETAYVVNDYPYGFHLRCKIRYWLEYRKGHGFRLMSQTTNPKRTDAEIWNKPKASIYAPIGVMYLDGNRYVQWQSLSVYDLEPLETYAQTFASALNTPEHEYELKYLRAVQAERIRRELIKKG